MARYGRVRGCADQAVPRPYLIHPAPATDGLDEVVEDGDVFEGEQLEQQVAGDNEDDEEWVPWLQGRP